MGTPLDYCPDCGKKGVLLRVRSGGEDYMGCRYCEWYAYLYSGSVIDRIEHERFEQAKTTRGKVPSRKTEIDALLKAGTEKVDARGSETT